MDYTGLLPLLLCLLADSLTKYAQDCESLASFLVALKAMICSELIVNKCPLIKLLVTPSDLSLESSLLLSLLLKLMQLFSTVFLLGFLLLPYFSF